MRSSYIRPNPVRFNYADHPVAARLIAEAVLACGCSIRNWHLWPPLASERRAENKKTAAARQRRQEQHDREMEEHRAKVDAGHRATAERMMPILRKLDLADAEELLTILMGAGIRRTGGCPAPCASDAPRGVSMSAASPHFTDPNSPLALPSSCGQPAMLRLSSRSGPGRP